MTRLPWWWRNDLPPDTDWPTSSAFARSLHGVDAAFPNEPRYANPIYHVGTRLRDRVIDGVWWAIGAGAVAALVWACLRVPM
jgi:hypothetical protein